MKTKYILTGILFLLSASIQPVASTTINYDVLNISGNTWEYAYTVSNDTLGINIEELTIFFESGDYENLSFAVAPGIPAWDPLVVEPNNFLNNDGFYDALALVSGITPGNSLGGFSVRFDYLVAGTPGPQLFHIVDPNDFSTLDSGQTNLVPIPAAIWLLSSGLIGLLGISRKKRNY